MLFTQKSTSYLPFKHPNSDFQLKAAKSKGVFGLEVWWFFVKGTIPFKYKPYL
jgi:hypothetical protein